MKICDFEHDKFYRLPAWSKKVYIIFYEVDYSHAYDYVGKEYKFSYNEANSSQWEECFPLKENIKSCLEKHLKLDDGSPIAELVANEIIKLI